MNNEHKVRQETCFKEKGVIKVQRKVGLKYLHRVITKTFAFFHPDTPVYFYVMLTYVLQYTCFNKSFTYVRRQAKRCLHYYESATHHFTMQGCVSAKAIVTGKSSFLPLTFKIVWAADSQLASNVIISYVPPLLPYALGGKRRGSATTSLVHRPETGSSQAERHCCGSASF